MFVLTYLRHSLLFLLASYLHSLQVGTHHFVILSANSKHGEETRICRILLNEILRITATIRTATIAVVTTPNLPYLRIVIK